ncbi:MAG: hypothetical protein SNJ52_01540 [Verrucomicrobiia bacterium]
MGAHLDTMGGFSAIVVYSLAKALASQASPSSHQEAELVRAP